MWWCFQFCCCGLGFVVAILCLLLCFALQVQRNPLLSISNLNKDQHLIFERSH